MTVYDWCNNTDSWSGYIARKGRKISEGVGKEVEGGNLGLTWSNFETSGGSNQKKTESLCQDAS